MPARFWPVAHQLRPSLSHPRHRVPSNHVLTSPRCGQGLLNRAGLQGTVCPVLPTPGYKCTCSMNGTVRNQTGGSQGSRGCFIPASTAELDRDRAPGTPEIHLSQPDSTNTGSPPESLTSGGSGISSGNTGRHHTLTNSETRTTWDGVDEHRFPRENVHRV